MNVKAKILNDIGVKKTKARIAVLDFLQAAQKPLDVLEIQQFLEKKKIEADKVTIYRILDLYVSKSLAKKLEFQEGKFRYEGTGEHHHHLICINCKTVEDIDLENDVTKHEKYIKEAKGFKVQSHSLEFFGLCKNCQ